MTNFDPSGMIVAYNFVVGILMMLSSEKIASFMGAFGTRTMRYTKVSIGTVGASWAFVAGTVYLFVHMLRIGV